MLTAIKIRIQKQQSTFALSQDASKNTHYIQKMLQIKVVKRWILSKKVSGRICPFPPGVEQGGSKDCHLWKIIIYQNGEIDSLWSSMLSKIRIICKNDSNKSFWALKSIQKSQWAHMSISPRSGGRGLRRLPSLKYYNVQKQQNWFTLVLEAAKNTGYIQKRFK